MDRARGDDSEESPEAADSRRRSLLERLQEIANGVPAHEPGGPAPSLESLSLEALVLAWRRGDPEAAALCIRRVWAIAWSVATSRFGFLREDAEDVAQDICIVAILRLDRGIRVSAWVFAATNHRCIDILRKREVSERALGLYAALHECVSRERSAAEVAGGAIDIRRAIAELPIVERTLLRMRFSLGMKWTEIDRTIFDGEERSRQRADVAIVWLTRRLDGRRARRPPVPSSSTGSVEPSKIP